jgi:NAD kinase
MQKRHTERKIVVVVRPTRVDDLKRRFNTLTQAKFFVRSRGGNFNDYENEDRAYKAAVTGATDFLQGWGRVQVIDRMFLPNFVFGPEDIIVAIGQDGLVANTLKYLLGGQPLIGVNPEPTRWDGVLLPFFVDDLQSVIPDVLARRHRERTVTMARATLNDGQDILAVNDFFIGQQSHVSARYIITSEGREETHSSSGVIVSTPLGSSGWLKSLLKGATGIAGALTGQSITVPPSTNAIPWESPKLFFTVREPFPSRSSQADLVFGEISPQSPLVIRSLMPEKGVLFSDGIEADFIEFNSGAVATITLAETRGHLVTP